MILIINNQSFSEDQREKKTIEKGFHDHAMLLEPFVDFFYLDVLCGSTEVEIALNAINQFNKPVLVGLHIKKNCKLPSG